VKAQKDLAESIRPSLMPRSWLAMDAPERIFFIV